MAWDTQTLQRAAGINFLVREPTVIQFGVDASRAGLIHVADAAAVCDALRALPQELTAQDIAAALHNAGLDITAARNVTEELIDFHLWCEPSAPAPLTFIGYSPFADMIAQALRDDGFVLRSPDCVTQDKDEDLAALEAYLATSDPETPAIVVDVQGMSPRFSAILSTHVRTWLPVTLLDQRALIGPLKRGGTGPCPLCLNLYRAELDPVWVPVMEQQAQSWPQPDPLLGAIAGARVVAAARFLTGQPTPAGAASGRWLAGEVHEVDCTGADHQRHNEPHARCPVCF